MKSLEKENVKHKDVLMLFRTSNLQGSIMIHFSLSTQITHSLSSLSLSTSLNSRSSTLPSLPLLAKGKLKLLPLLENVCVWRSEFYEVTFKIFFLKIIFSWILRFTKCFLPFYILKVTRFVLIGNYLLELFHVDVSLKYTCLISFIYHFLPFLLLCIN